MLFIPGIDLSVAREKSVYIYGAGSTGQKTYEKLLNNGINPTGFIDSFKGGHKINGLRVWTLSDYMKVHSPEDLIVVASEFQHAIGASLRQNGISDFVSSFHLSYEKDQSRLHSEERKIRERLIDVLSAIPQEFRENFNENSAIDQVIDWSYAYGFLSNSAGYNSISMLHPEIHAIAQLLSLLCNGGVLEIGAYVGGLSIPIAISTRKSGKNFVSVEPGGAHPDHPTLGTNDIAKDLIDHLDHFSVKDAVTSIIGRVDDPLVCQDIGAILNADGIGLYIDDSDGNVDSHFNNFQYLTRRGTFIIVDDFIDNYTCASMNKSKNTRKSIYKKVVNDRLGEIGIFGYGTWIGYQKAESII